MSDDSTPLQDAATQVHEMFMAFFEAGFTREEALAIVLTQLAKAVPPGGAA